MTQAKNGSIIATVIICAVLLGGFAYLMMPEVPEVPTAAEIALAVNVPTAAEVAALISVPAAPVVDNSDSQTVLCGLYESECNDLEDEVIDALKEEYEFGEANPDYMDEIRDLIEGKEGEEIKSLTITNWNYRNDYDFKSINLGLDDSEDKAGAIEVTFRVSYKLKDNPSDTLKDNVYVTGTASDWDDRDKEFDTVDATFTL